MRAKNVRPMEIVPVQKYRLGKIDVNGRVLRSWMVLSATFKLPLENVCACVARATEYAYRWD